METNTSRWIILLLALLCVVPVASAFNIKTETVNPPSGDLEVGQVVTAHYVIVYSSSRMGSDETFDFSTGLQNPMWTFIIYRDGIPIYTTEKTGYYPSLGAFELTYTGKVELDVQLRGTVPQTASGEVKIVKLEYTASKNVLDDYCMTRKVGSSLSVQQQDLNNLKIDIDTKASEGVNVYAAQAKYNVASQALASAASAGPSQASGYILAAKKAIDEARVLLDEAWADKEVANAAASLGSLDGMITYFVKDLSMESDPQVIAIVSKRESAAQFYSQAKDSLNAKNYPLARSKVVEGQNRASEALSDANVLLERICKEFVPAQTPAPAGDVETYPSASSGSFDIRSTPSEASIYIDGLYRGDTPGVVTGLSAGSHQVRILKGGYHDYVLTTTIDAGKETAVSATLIPEPAYSAAGATADVSLTDTSLYAGIAVISAIVLSAGYFIHSKRSRKVRGGVTRAGSPDSPSVSAPNGKDYPPDTPDRNGVDGGSIRPEISIALSHTAIYAGEWDKIGLTLVNTGTDPAFDVTLTFSADVETRFLRPVDLPAGEGRTIEAGIKSRTRGKVPLEVVARYRDGRNRTYKQVTSFWLSVEPRVDSPIPPSIPRPVTPASLPPEMVDQYTASEYLGKGGFARVFKVQKPDGSWAALKIPISLDAATGKSFIAELQNWTSMVHENIVRVNDYNIMPFPYFEMELCDGTLSDLKKPVLPDRAAWLLFSVCEGLKYAHARGILHRDLKPQNIMLKGGVPKISDWGLSKVMTESQTTTASGGFTAYYAAPEQIKGDQKDERTDIWQLGVILYELVTGRLPFAGESMVEIGMAIATNAPERPGGVHPGAQPLDAIILKCLEKQLEQRYQSVAGLQKDLAAYLKLNYAELLKESIQVNDLNRSAYYCGDLVLISMKAGNLGDAYKYAIDLAKYSIGEARVQADELAKQIKMRIEMGAQELPDELIRKAEVIVHQVRMW